MKIFILKIVLFCTIVLIINLIFISFADGLTDPYYSKLSSPKQKALVLGASRANEGIIPSVIDSVFQTKRESINLYNYAFSNSDSPYGPTYLNAIKKKINKKKNSIFILSVHPWCLSLLNELESEANLLEKRLTLGKVSNYSGSPNYNYFLRAYEYGTGNILLKKIENRLSKYLYSHKLIKNGGTIEVKNDGWLENTYYNNDTDAINLRMNKKNRSLFKKDYATKFRFSLSQLRIVYLNKTIKYLKEFGTVYLVRIPTASKVQQIEYEYMPSFDSIIASISKNNDVEYIEIKDEFTYSDGHHLDQVSAKKYSIQLANLIYLKK